MGPEPIFEFSIAQRPTTACDGKDIDALLDAYVRVRSYPGIRLWHVICQRAL